ncbi:MAG: TlpA family protein disulfide reductase [Nitrospinae bacterium]|nr:TlpA family protein disulfide reductase [Nitrospinota bacterium]
MEQAVGPEKAPEPKTAGRRNLIVLLAVLGVGLYSIFNLMVSNASGRAEILKVGSQLPAFSLKFGEGKEFTNRDFAGKPTLYFFFANWCPCSHQSVDFIKQAVAENADKGLTAVGVGIQDVPKNIETFVKRHDIKFTVGDRGGDDMAGKIGVRTTPTILLVDSGGVIRWIYIGKVERYDQIKPGLAELFKG